MAIDTFGEYLDFHPHLHALVADGLFARSGLFHVMPDVSLKPLEDLFRARVITFLVDKGLLPVARANKMRGQRDKHAAEEAEAAGRAVQIIDVSEHQPRRIPSAKWRELIKKVWEDKVYANG